MIKLGTEKELSHDQEQLTKMMMMTMPLRMMKMSSDQKAQRKRIKKRTLLKIYQMFRF